MVFPLEDLATLSYHQVSKCVCLKRWNSKMKGREWNRVGQGRVGDKKRGREAVN